MFCQYDIPSIIPISDSHKFFEILAYSKSDGYNLK